MNPLATTASQQWVWLATSQQVAQCPGIPRDPEATLDRDHRYRD